MSAVPVAMVLVVSGAAGAWLLGHASGGGRGEATAALGFLFSILAVAMFAQIAAWAMQGDLHGMLFGADGAGRATRGESK